MYIRPPKETAFLTCPGIDSAGAHCGGSLFFDLPPRYDRADPDRPYPYPPPTANDVMAEAAAVRAGRPGWPLTLYTEAAALDPEDADPLVWSAHILTLRERTGEAVEKARRLSALAP